MLCHTPDQDSSFFLKFEKFVAMWQLIRKVSASHVYNFPFRSFKALGTVFGSHTVGSQVKGRLNLYYGE